MTNKFKIVIIQPNNVPPFPKLKVSKITQFVMFETLQPGFIFMETDTHRKHFMISGLKYIILKIKQETEWSSRKCRKSQLADFFMSLSYTYYAESIAIFSLAF